MTSDPKRLLGRGIVSEPDPRDELSPRDLDILSSGHCPACAARGFILGPAGGAAINIECANLECRARYNVVSFGGQILMGQTIPSEAEGGPKWPTAPAHFGQGSGHRGNFS